MNSEDLVKKLVCIGSKLFEGIVLDLNGEGLDGVGSEHLVLVASHLQKLQLDLHELLIVALHEFLLGLEHRGEQIQEVLLQVVVAVQEVVQDVLHNEREDVRVDAFL